MASNQSRTIHIVDNFTGNKAHANVQGRVVGLSSEVHEGHLIRLIARLSFGIACYPAAKSYQICTFSPFRTATSLSNQSRPHLSREVGTLLPNSNTFHIFPHFALFRTSDGSSFPWPRPTNCWCSREWQTWFVSYAQSFHVLCPEPDSSCPLSR